MQVIYGSKLIDTDSLSEELNFLNLYISASHGLSNKQMFNADQ